MRMTNEVIHIKFVPSTTGGVSLQQQWNLNFNRTHVTVIPILNAPETIYPESGRIRNT